MYEFLSDQFINYSNILLDIFSLLCNLIVLLRTFITKGLVTNNGEGGYKMGGGAREFRKGGWRKQF